MIFSLGLAQQILILAAFVVVIVALISRFVFPLVQNKIQLLPARLQANILIFICFLPVLMVILTLGISFLPNLLNVFGFGPAHCDIHANSHSHLCTVLEPLPMGHWLTWLSILFFLVIIASVGFLLRDIIRSYRFGCHFSSADKVFVKQGVWLVKDDSPFAFITGLIRPIVFISTALKTNLSDRQLDIVLAHEGDHKKYHDVLRHTVARAVSLMHFPSIRKTLLAQLSLATEKACDETAAIMTGNRVEVAETLVAIERLYRGDFSATGPVALGVGGNTVVERVKTLLDDTEPQSFNANWFFGALALVLFTVSVNGVQLHHMIENFLDQFPH